MSTPHPLEDQALLDPRDMSDPWKGPVAPRWYSGMQFDEDTAYLGPLYRALEGAGQGAAKGEELLSGAWHGIASAGEQIPGVGHFFRPLEEASAKVQQDARDRVKRLTPDAATTGWVAQTMNGLSSGLYRYTVGALAGGPLGELGVAAEGGAVGGAALGGATAVGATEGSSRLQELEEQGVTPGAAGAAAAVTGLFSGAGALLPVGFGSSLASKMITGAAGNAGFGLASRYADHKVLEAAGYPEMAAQQAVWDKYAVMTDLVLGGAFGTLAHLGHPENAQAAELARRQAELKFGRGSPGAEDAALTMDLSLRDRHSSPGVPVDPQAGNAHQEAFETALTDIAQGKPVDVSRTGVAQGAAFAQRPPADYSDAQTLFINALKDAGVLEHQRNLETLEQALGARLRGEAGPEEPAAAAPASTWQIPRAEEGDLSTGDRAIETRFAEAMQNDYEGMKARYAQLPEAAGGKVLNVDTARELSPEYLADRTRSAAVHEPASEFVKRLYAEKLAEPPGPGQDPMVLFTGGGTDAGKSSAVRGALGPAADRAQIVFDTNMNNVESAKAKIDQALAAGKQVQIAYVYRHPVEALTGGALPRAMRQEREFGSGRTVPIEKHLGTHEGSNSAIRELARDYGNDPRVKIALIDNSQGRGNQRLLGRVEDIPQIDYNRAREEASAALEAAHAEGRISPAVFRGFAGREPGSEPAPGAGSAAVQREHSQSGKPATLGAGPGGQSSPERLGGRSNQLGKVDPLADPAHQAVQENPQMQIPDENGNLVNAASELSQADQSVADAERDTQKALMAAINCFQRRGAA